MKAIQLSLNNDKQRIKMKLPLAEYAQIKLTTNSKDFPAHGVDHMFSNNIHNGNQMCGNVVVANYSIVVKSSCNINNTCRTEVL